MKNKAFICDCCGQQFPEHQQTEFNDQLLCPTCLASETVICHVCGNRIWSDDSEGDGGTPLCQRCYNRYYTNCIRCGALLRLEDARYHADDIDEEEPLCTSCYTQSARIAVIQDYYYKPEPIFYGEGARFFGVELEIDYGGENNCHAQSILEQANLNGTERMYCKHDGSLDNGFELVTHPMTLTYHQREMPWSGVLSRAIQLDYKSHQAGTCGLHIHVNRDAFGDTAARQDAAIARILYFFEKHWQELLKFSRRTPRQLERWAARYGYKEQPSDILEHAKKGGHGGRYTCVNLQNDSTIEFRIFRGTLKLNTLIATLQLVDRICDVALSLSDDELKAVSWSTFVSGCQAPELIQYLKERRLYINEAVAAEEEI